MSRRVRVGVVGTSIAAEYLHLRSLSHHPHAEVTAICARNPERTRAMAEKHSIPQIYAEYAEMIRKGGLDAIVVAAPDDLHYAITMQALDAGLHVLCEKPLALTAQQAQEMYEKAENAKVKHMVMFTYRWMPFFRYARDLIDQGYVGSCYGCEFHYLMGHGRSGRYGWRFDRQRANGTLADMGSHMIDLARWLVGDIVRVGVQLGVCVDRVGPDGEPMNSANDSAFLLVGFAHGGHGMIHASSVAHVADRHMQQQVHLYGQAGSLEIDVLYGGAEAGAVIRGARNEDKRFDILDVPAEYWGDVDPSDPIEVFSKHSAGPRAFVDAIVGDLQPTPSFYDGFRVQQVIESAIEAGTSGRSTTLAVAT